MRFKLPIGILSQHLQHRIHCSKNQKTKKTDNIVTGMHQMATHQHFPESRTFFFQSDKIFNRAEQTKYLFHSIFASSKSMKSLLKYTKTYTYYIHNGMQPENVYLPEAYFDISEHKQRLLSLRFLSKSLKSIPKTCTKQGDKARKTSIPEAHEAAVE